MFYPSLTFALYYNMFDYCYLQLTEALLFLHYSCKLIHRNVCPQSVLINKKGTWKLAGLEFTEKCADGDLMVSFHSYKFNPQKTLFQSLFHFNTKKALFHSLFHFNLYLSKDYIWFSSTLIAYIVTKAHQWNLFQNVLSK
jgi:hypothetical protein